MPGKITDLAALTGAVAATTDLLEAVDVSDTSMAATGTNKKMSLAEMVVFFQANGLGATSAASGVFPFMYQTATAETITGSALRGNNATFTSSTKLWVSETTTDGLNVAVGFGRMKAGFQVYIQDYADSSKYALFNVTADATDKGSYWEITVALASSAGTIGAGKVALQSLSTAQASKLFSTTTTIPGLTPGSNGAGASAYLDGSGAWSTPGGGGGTPIGTKLTDFASLTGAVAAAGDIIEVVDISDTTMAASGTNKKMTLAELKLFLSNPAALYNASIASQGAGFATDTYVTGSGILVPVTRLQSKTIYRCQIVLSKTAAGTATPIVTVRFGTAGTTADASVGAMTFIAGTAAIDEGVIDLSVIFRSVGSGTSAVVQSASRITHRLSVTGITGAASTSPAQVAVSSGFNSTVASSIIGVSVNGGTAAAWTVQHVTAELLNLV